VSECLPSDAAGMRTPSASNAISCNHTTMTLRSGVRLGPYEIVAPIGAGGMGEVYKARDTRLGRAVAVKILPSEFASDVKLKLRFEREAKAISSLNHPNICTLHDIGRERDVDYLVMELCEGKTLAQKLEDGPLPIEQVLDYGVQIADGLDKAHRKGIVHRDLKPSNIMLTKSGVKLLDFGLAKQVTAIGSAAGTQTSTVDQPLTGDSTIAGTLQYMAPETLTSGQVDARSDIYALGLVLYEMIGGRPAFASDSRAKLVAAILEREPAALSSANADLDHVVVRCLRKDPDDRWQSASDISEDLRWMRARPGSSVAAASSHATRFAIAALMLLLMSATAIAIVLWMRRPMQKVERRLTSIFFRNAPLTLSTGRSFAVSPDGRTIAFICGTPWRLFLRSAADGIETEVPNSERALEPMFAPDGTWLAFSQLGKLKKLELATGDVRTIGDDGSKGANFVRGAWANKTASFSMSVVAPFSSSPPRVARPSTLCERTPAVCMRRFCPAGIARFSTAPQRQMRMNARSKCSTSTVTK